MVREDFGQMRADLQLSVHLGAIEADQAGIGSKLQRVVAGVALVPGVHESRVELPRLPIPVRFRRILSYAHLSLRSISSNTDSIRRSGISHISATSA